MAKKFMTRLPFYMRPASGIRLGTHVHLKPFQGSPAECGEYMGNSGEGVAMICVCPQHRSVGDDGLREVTYDQLKNKK